MNRKNGRNAMKIATTQLLKGYNLRKNSSCGSDRTKPKCSVVPKFSPKIIIKYWTLGKV